jgi:prevent-host-death family protein
VEVNIHKAKTHLSRLLEQVLLGEEVVIAKAGRPIAKLVPVGDGQRPRTLGTAKEDFIVPEDFNQPLPDDLESDFWK